MNSRLLWLWICLFEICCNLVLKLIFHGLLYWILKPNTKLIVQLFLAAFLSNLLLCSFVSSAVGYLLWLAIFLRLEGLSDAAVKFWLQLQGYFSWLWLLVFLVVEWYFGVGLAELVLAVVIVGRRWCGRWRMAFGGYLECLLHVRMDRLPRLS